MVTPAHERGWIVEHNTGTAAALHDRPLPDPLTPTVWVNEVAGPAFVLGSTQDDGLIRRDEATAAGIEICRRRSGGGLVILRPGIELWVDVLLPRGSSLWSDDISAAFGWLGALWADVLRATLEPSSPAIVVHRGPLIDREAGRVLCFAGLGPGEVVVDGAKVVGISQRRTRHGARFQCAVTPGWDPADLEPFLDRAALAGAGIDLRRLAVGLDSRWWGPSIRGQIVAELVDRLPSPTAPVDPAPA